MYMNQVTKKRIKIMKYRTSLIYILYSLHVHPIGFHFTIPFLNIYDDSIDFRYPSGTSGYVSVQSGNISLPLSMTGVNFVASEGVRTFSNDGVLTVAKLTQEMLTLGRRDCAEDSCKGLYKYTVRFCIYPSTSVSLLSLTKMSTYVNKHMVIYMNIEK